MSKVIGILLICSVIVLSACERDIGITDQLLPKTDPNAQAVAVAPSAIPDWLKEKIWKDEEILIEELSALGEGNAERKIDLSRQIVNRKEQDWFYRKWIDADGIAIIGTYGVEDFEFEKARNIILTMTSKIPRLRQHLNPNAGFYMVLFDPSEYFSFRDFPEYYELIYNVKIPVPIGLFRGVCRFGNRIKVCLAPTSKTVVIGSKYHGENCSPNWWCRMRFNSAKWNTFVHEFAHAMEKAIATEDRTFYIKLEQAYKNAVEKNLWTYAGVSLSSKNSGEYWASNSENWFIPQPTHKGNKRGKDDRWGTEIVDIPEMSQRTLKELDPKLYALMSKWYPATEFVAIE